NNDGQVDFRFDYVFTTFQSVYSHYSKWYASALEYSNQLLGIKSSGVFALSSGNVIDSNQLWIDTNYPFFGTFRKWSSWFSSFHSGYESVGFWINIKDRFAGLKLIVGADILYGWVRMDAKLKKHLIIKDYAYNSTPNQPILAGEGLPTSIN